MRRKIVPQLTVIENAECIFARIPCIERSRHLAVMSCIEMHCYDLFCLHQYFVCSRVGSLNAASHRGRAFDDMRLQEAFNAYAVLFLASVVIRELLCVVESFVSLLCVVECWSWAFQTHAPVAVYGFVSMVFDNETDLMLVLQCGSCMGALEQR